MTTGWLLLLVVVYSQSVDSQSTTDDESCSDEGRLAKQQKNILERILDNQHQIFQQHQTLLDVQQQLFQQQQTLLDNQRQILQLNQTLVDNQRQLIDRLSKSCFQL